MTCSVTARLSVGSPVRSRRERRMRYDSARAGSEPGSAPGWELGSAPGRANVTDHTYRAAGSSGQRRVEAEAGGTGGDAGREGRDGREGGRGRVHWAGFWTGSVPGAAVCQPFTSKLSAGPGSVSERNPVESRMAIQAVCGSQDSTVHGCLRTGPAPGARTTT